jgi:hypothetical protein
MIQIMLSFVFFGAVIGATFAIIMIPDKWDKGTVIKICSGGTAIMRMEDGSIMALRRGAWRGLKVAAPDTVCQR